MTLLLAAMVAFAFLLGVIALLAAVAGAFFRPCSRLSCWRWPGALGVAATGSPRAKGGLPR